MSLDSLWQLVAENSLHASLFIGCVLALRAVFHRHLPAQCFHLLWILVALRLLSPVIPSSTWSVFNLVEPRGISNPVHQPQWSVRTTFGKPSETPVGGAPKGPGNHPVSISKPTPVETIRSWIPAFWTAGVLVQLVLMAFSARRVRRLLAPAAPVADEHLCELTRDCAEQTGLARPPSLYESGLIPGPVVVGLWRPRLVLPRDLHLRLSASELQFVLLHECAHLRRRDLLSVWSMALARLVHWFNPLVWLVERLSRIDMELACDEAVLRQNGDPEGYGSTLLKLAQAAPWQRPALSQVGLLEAKGAMRTRIQRIAGYTPKRALRTIAGLLIVVCVSFAFGANAQKPASSDAPPSDQPAASPDHPNTTAQPATWDKGWSAVQIRIPSAGNIAHAYVDLTSPAGRPVTLTEGVRSREGVILDRVEWVRSPVRAKIVLRKDNQRAELFLNPSAISRKHDLRRVLPQIEIQAKFVEVSDGALAKLPYLQPPRPGQQALFWITQEQLERLFHEDGVKLLSCPRVTTRSEQRAIIEIVREFRYATDWELVPGGKHWAPSAWDTQNLGATFEVTPSLDENDVLTLEVAPKFVEFLGWIDHETKKPLAAAKYDPSADLFQQVLMPQIDPKAKLSERMQSIFDKRQARSIFTSEAGQTWVMVLKNAEETTPFAPNCKTLLALVSAERLGSVPGAESPK